jgi:hypothetical protein
VSNTKAREKSLRKALDKAYEEEAGLLQDSQDRKLKAKASRLRRSEPKSAFSRKRYRGSKRKQEL